MAGTKIIFAGAGGEILLGPCIRPVFFLLQCLQMNALKGWKSILMIPNDIENSVYDDDDGNIQRGVMPVEAAVRLSIVVGRLYSGRCATRPRSCHGSSPGGTAPALRGQAVDTSVTVGQLWAVVAVRDFSSCHHGAPHHGGARGLHPDARDHNEQLCQQPKEKVSQNILFLTFHFVGQM